MKGTTKKPKSNAIARNALKRAADPVEPDVGRLVDALPEIMAEARRRRTSQAQPEPIISLVVALARTAIPRLAAVSAMLVLASTFFAFRGATETTESGSDLDEYILTGEMSDDVSDVLLEALTEQGKDHG